MRIQTTPALFVFCASLAHATLAYSVPQLDLSDHLAESLDLVDPFAVTLSAGGPPADLFEPEESNIIKYTSPEGPNAPPLTAWIELFHQR